MNEQQGTLDLIIDTIAHPHDMEPYINLLKVDGALWVLGTLERLSPSTGR